jgi:ABC-type uncharacterized transport system involved in gliding motility auxiliary subunit
VALRDRLSTRTVLYGGGSAAAVALVLAILVVVNLLAGRYPGRLDLTQGKSQSLTAVTLALLKDVDKPLTLTAFFPEGQGDRQRAREVLENYTYANPKVSFTFVDPDREPHKAREAGFRFPGNVLLEYDGRRQMADRADEEALSEALRRLLRPQQKKVYFLTGHGERSLEEPRREGLLTAKRALENEGFLLAELNLLQQGKIPPEAAAVVVAGPVKPLFPQEIAALKEYLGRGGRLLVMLEPFQDAGLKDFLAGYGVELNDGLVLDHNQVSQALGASVVMPIAVKYGPHRITRDFTNVVTLFPLARPLGLRRDLPGAAGLPLALSTQTSWEKIGREVLKKEEWDFNPQKDRQGPFHLAVLVELKPPERKDAAAGPTAAPDKPQEMGKTAYLAVFGDVDFATNGYFNLSMNGDLFLNTVNFLAEEEKQILIRRDEKKPQPLSLTSWQIYGLFFLTLILIPGAMLAAGVAAYVRRRARR